MRDFFFDLETFSRNPLKDGTHRYVEGGCEVMLWSYALEDGQIKVWDKLHDSVHWEDELSGVWCEASLKPGAMPVDLKEGLCNSENAVWGQNSGHFDFVVLDKVEPRIGAMIPMERRRDTMVQAFSHALPGALEKLGEILNIAESKRKIKEGKKLVQLFCKLQNEAFQEKHGTDRATKATHPAEWQRFIEYAGGDITTMREARRLMPKWNYRDGLQMRLWHLDCKINQRGFAVDLDLAHAAVRAADAEKARLAKRTKEQTDDAVGAATQRDELLKYILAEYGIELPDMQSDTLERRLDDPDLPDGVKELLRIRLQASRNTSAKFKTLLRAVSADGRMRGWGQFRGAGRTGRRAHRKFQPGNLMRPTMSPTQIDLAIEALKSGTEDLLFNNVMEAIGNTVRGAIVAKPGNKLVVADLSNIEGRVAAWLAGEEWKVGAFREFDESLILGLDGKPLLNEKGERQFASPDLYIRSYAASFNVPIESVPKKGGERQIGKVCLAKGTLVLTDSGWLLIEHVSRSHKLWDGEQWVSHMGLISQGVKPVISLAALSLTPDHCVLSGTRWLEAGRLLRGKQDLSLALATGVEHLPSRAISLALWAGLRWCSFTAIAGALSTAFSRTTFAVAAVLGAPSAAVAQAQNVGGNTLRPCRRQSTASGFSPASLQRVSAAHHLTMQVGSTTVGGVSGFATSGSKIEQRFSDTLGRFRGGMTQAWKWIARTLTGITNQGISVSSRNERTTSTVGLFASCRLRSTNSERKMPTFDLACAGPRRRFTVMSARGPLIVHNCELMFQYGGGVGAWLTGAATYGIDLDQMTEQVYPTLPAWAVSEAEKFLLWLYEQNTAKLVAKRQKLDDKVTGGEVVYEEIQTEWEDIEAQIEAAKLKARFSLPEKVFVACDAIKRLWRKKHPAIASYWKELEDTIRRALDNPGETFPCRKLKIRRDGAWLRIGLPSGRALCYPNPKIEKGKITYTGLNQYTRQWGRVSTYGGKIFENVTQAVAADQLFEAQLLIDDDYPIVLDVHDENVTETPDDPRFTADELARRMCSDLGWNKGLPLAAAGAEMYRYAKG